MKRIAYKIQEASVSVEAAYIMPIILGVIFAVMTLSFYFYDVAAAQAVLDRSLEEMGNLFVHPCKEDLFYDYGAVNERFLNSWSQDSSKWESAWKEKIENNLSKTLILLKKSKTEIEVKKKKISAAVELSYVGSIPFIRKYIPFLGKTRKLTKTITEYHPSDFVRLISIVEERRDFFGITS